MNLGPDMIKAIGSLDYFDEKVLPVLETNLLKDTASL